MTSLKAPIGDRERSRFAERTKNRNEAALAWLSMAAKKWHRQRQFGRRKEKGPAAKTQITVPVARSLLRVLPFFVVVVFSL